MCYTNVRFKISDKEVCSLPSTKPFKRQENKNENGGEIIDKSTIRTREFESKLFSSSSGGTRVRSK
ncbi:hypothetical protein GCM10007971_35080 [Oceanobacillus indicireducens]|uniref:Uncharacterized protein n=1 Tax=Oceanobacillus indicireducens TaxID=1004261 RepID=A0A917Y317_9BACI|nr:hypothetical protein GCM10007971_35080 [Oceanobacillus indicireducens]